VSGLEFVVVIVIVFFALGIAFGVIAVIALSVLRADGGRARARRAARARRMAEFGAARQARETDDWTEPGWTRRGWNDTIASPYRGDGDDEPGATLQDAPPSWPGALSG
jgi:hypothetical protein